MSPSRLRRVATVGLGGLLLLTGCGTPAIGSPSAERSAIAPSASGRPTSPAVSASGSAGTAPSASTVPVPERITWFAGGTTVAAPSGEPPVTARSFATGIQAFEPTIGILRDGSFAFQGWDRPEADRWGTSHVFVGAAGGPWRDITALPATITHDPYMAVDPDSGRIFSANLLLPGELDPSVFCVTVTSTVDFATWSSAEPVCDSDADRPRVIAAAPVSSRPTVGSNLIHLCYFHSRADGQTCHRSLDGGRTFLPTGGMPPDGCDPGPSGANFGHMTADSAGVLYLPRMSCRKPVVAISRDEGMTWEQHVIGPEGWNGYNEVGVAVDAEGTVFGLWVDAERLPWLAASTDGGRTWSAPVRVSPPGVTEVNLPVLEAGAAGRVAIGMLASIDAPAGIKPSVASQCNIAPCREPVFYENATWHALLTVSVDALAAQPTFVTAVLNDPTEPIVRGACGPGRCKANGDFLDAVIDAAGAPWLAYVACPDGRCLINARGAPVSSEGMLGTIDGPALR